MNHQPHQSSDKSKRNLLALIAIAILAAIVGIYNYFAYQSSAKHLINNALSQVQHPSEQVASNGANTPAVNNVEANQDQAPSTVTTTTTVDNTPSEVTSSQATDVNVPATGETSPAVEFKEVDPKTLPSVGTHPTVVLGDENDAFGQVVIDPKTNSLDVNQAVVAVDSRPLIDIYIEAYEKYLDPKYRQSIPYEGGSTEDITAGLRACINATKEDTTKATNHLTTPEANPSASSTPATTQDNSTELSSIPSDCATSLSDLSQQPGTAITPTATTSANPTAPTQPVVGSGQSLDTNSTPQASVLTSTVIPTTTNVPSTPSTPNTPNTVSTPSTSNTAIPTNNSSVAIIASSPVGTNGTKVAPVYNINQQLQQPLTKQVPTANSNSAPFQGNTSLSVTDTPASNVNITNSVKPAIQAVNPDAPVLPHTVIGPKAPDAVAADSGSNNVESATTTPASNQATDNSATNSNSDLGGVSNYQAPSSDPDGVVDIYRFHLPYTNVPFINQFFQQQLLDAYAGKDSTQLKVALPNTKVVPTIPEIYRQVQVLTENQVPVPEFKYHDLLHAPAYYNHWNNNYKEKHDIFFYGQIKNVAVFENISYFYPLGASHGMYALDYYNFDLVNHQEISDTDLVPEANRPALVHLLYKSLLTYIRNHFVSSRDRTISDAALAQEYAYGFDQGQMYVSSVFNFDKTGITFTYQGIDILGKGFLDPVPLTINYADLAGIVPDKYLNLR